MWACQEGPVSRLQRWVVGGFTVDQFNNVTEAINVNISNENMNWNAVLGYIYHGILS